MCMCVYEGVYLLYVCMYVRANAWPFSQRINRSSVAAVTGEIRDWLCPCLSHHPSSSALSVHLRVRGYAVHVYMDALLWRRQTEDDRRDRRAIKKSK